MGTVLHYLKWLRDYCATLVREASTKVTTYVAIVPAGLKELLDNWEQAASIFPHWLIAQKPHLMSVSALLIAWSRVRRLLPSPPPLPGSKPPDSAPPP